MAGEFSSGLGAGVQFGMAVNRGIEHTRQLMQQRANQREAKQVLGALSEQLKTLESAASVADQEFQALEEERQVKGRVDPERYQQAMTKMYLTGLKTVEHRQNLLMDTIAQNPENPFILEPAKQMVEQNMAGMQNLQDFLSRQQSARTQTDVERLRGERQEAGMAHERDILGRKQAGDLEQLRASHNMQLDRIRARGASDLATALAKKTGEDRVKQAKLMRDIYNDAWLEAEDLESSGYFADMAEETGIPEVQLKRAFVADRAPKLAAELGLIDASDVPAAPAAAPASSEPAPQDAPGATISPSEGQEPRMGRMGGLSPAEAAESTARRMPEPGTEVHLADLPDAISQAWDRWLRGESSSPPVGRSRSGTARIDEEGSEAAE